MTDQKRRASSTVRQQSEAQEPEANPSSTSRELDRGTGFLSMTSLSSTFPEKESTLSNRDCSTITRTGVTFSSATFLPEPAHIQDGAQVLELLFSQFPALHQLIKRWYDDLDDSPSGGPILKASWHAMQIAHKDFLKEDSQECLWTMSRTIFENTSKTLELPQSAQGNALSQSLAGANLRWETVGLFCALAGPAISTAENISNIFLGSGCQDLDQKSFMRWMLNACTRCESFCDQISQANDLTLWLAYMATMLATWCYGDDSYRAWRLLGNLTSIVFALGLHNDDKNDQGTPLYLRELRKRGFALAYELDKSLATFVGRPPRLSRHYCAINLPLDLSDAALMGSFDDLELAKKRLDANGWNVDNIIQPASRCRATLMINTIREEVLELSLGLPVYDLEQQAQQVLKRSELLWESMPPFMQYSSALWNNMRPFSVLVLLYLRLEHLYSEFLLHKLLVHRTSSSRNNLLQSAHQILSLILSTIQQRNILSKHRMDLECTVAFYGLPSASVLILELLRQMQHPQQNLPLTRSKIIRDLSVFISCLDWLTEPGQSNYEVCKQAQMIFSRRLDQVLDQPAVTTRVPDQNISIPTPNSTSWEAGENGDIQDPVLVDSTALMQDPEFAAWFDKFDLQMDPWLNPIYNPTCGP